MMTRHFDLFVAAMFAVMFAVPLASAAQQDSSQAQAVAGRQVYEGPPLSLQAALDEALARNPELIALRARFEAARHRPAQERSLAAPTFEAQIWQWPLSTLNPAKVNMYMFTAMQDIPDRGKRALRAAVAEKDLQLAEADIAVEAREVIDMVKRTYAELFLSRKAIEVNRDSLDLLRQFADIASVKYTTGRSSQQETMKAIVEISWLHDDLVMLDQRAALAEARLNTLLDRRPEAPIGPLAESRERVLLPAAADLQRLALEQQPELRAAALGVERSAAALAVATRDYRPDFFAGGGYMLLPRETDAWTITAGITWPSAPWARGRLDAKKAEATADVEAARARQRTVENAIRHAVQAAYIRVKSAEQRASLLRTTIIPQSRQTLEVARVGYQSDRVDFLALLEDQRTLLDAQLEYYRALSELEQALAGLERAMGADITPQMSRLIDTREVTK